jgi:hypothetical protein
LDVADTALEGRSATDIAALTLGIARLLKKSRREGRVVDSIRVTLVAHDTTGGRDRTYRRWLTYSTKLLRRAADSP